MSTSNITSIAYNEKLKDVPNISLYPEISALKSILMIHIYYDKSLGTSVNGFINPT